MSQHCYGMRKKMEVGSVVHRKHQEKAFLEVSKANGAGMLAEDGVREG